MAFASSCGSAFLAAIFLVYWLPPVIAGLRGTPPTIIRFAYSLLTIWGLISGVQIIRSPLLKQAVTLFLTRVLQAEATPSRVMLVLVAILSALCFVIANLVRSYYNLHAIEHPEKADHPLHLLVAALSSSQRGPTPGWFRAVASWLIRAKTVEYFLRVGMFVIILFLNDLIINFSSGGQALDVHAFLGSFDRFWLFAISFYAVLLIWDGVIHCAQSRSMAPPGVCAAVHHILMWQAYPIHGLGLLISIVMFAAMHLPSVIDLLAVFLVVLASVGIILFVYSAYLDVKRMFTASPAAPSASPAHV